MTCEPPRASLAGEPQALQAMACAPLLRPALSLDAPALTTHNRLHQRREGWAGQGVVVEFAARGADAQEALTLNIAIGAQPSRLRIPPALLRHWGVADQAAASSPGLAESLLIEQALLAFIEPLEARFNLPIRVLQPIAAVPLDAALDFGLSIRLQANTHRPGSANPVGGRLAGEGVPEAPSAGKPGTHKEGVVGQAVDNPWHCLHFAFNATTATLIADLLDQHLPPLREPMPGLPLPATLQHGQAPLTLAELRSLQPGDIVMLDHPEPRLNIAHTLYAPARIDAAQIRLQQAPQPLHRNTPMTDPVAPDSSLDTVPLELVCQVGSYALTLGQLRELGAGSVLPLPAANAERVDLLVNGHRVGHGELVRIGTGLGVRVLGLTQA